jgi:hypothetical protein
MAMIEPETVRPEDFDSPAFCDTFIMTVLHGKLPYTAMQIGRFAKAIGRPPEFIYERLNNYLARRAPNPGSTN